MIAREHACYKLEFENIDACENSVYKMKVSFCDCGLESPKKAFRLILNTMIVVGIYLYSTENRKVIFCLPI